MTDTLKDGFPETASCGFRKECGSWDIYLGLPDDLSASSLNARAAAMIRAFLSAFHALCRPVEVMFDTISFAANGRVKEVKEVEVRQISGGDQDQFLRELLSNVEKDECSFFTAIRVVCDLKVFVPLAEGALHRVWVPRSATFYLGYVLEPDDEDLLVPVDGSISFESSVDVWVGRTLDSMSAWQDNHACAAQNQPLLEEALKAWERLAGKPMTEWNSRYYRDQVFKYGFRLDQ